MQAILFVDPTGERHRVEGAAGRSLMRLALNASVPGIVAECGGCMTCGTCHVHLTPDVFAALPSPSEDEQMMLEMLIDRDATSRLSCQIRMSETLNGAVVTVAKGNG